MKKIGLFIGDHPDHFINNLKMFEFLEEKLNCKIKKKNKFLYVSQIGSLKLYFQFCFGSNNDSLRKKRIKLKGEVPPSIKDLSKLNLSFDEVYYLGLCGIFRGKPNSWYAPTCFKKVNFKNYFLSEKDAKYLKVSKPIYCKNNLIDRLKFPAKECTALTLNQVAAPKYALNNSEEAIIKIANKLKNHTDICEMENYALVKLFKNKSIFGSLIYGVDNPLKKKFMIKQGMSHIDWNTFKKGILSALQTIID